MSSKELAALKGPMSKALAERFDDDLNDDLTSGVSGGFAVMSFRGSKWRVKHGGEETPIVDSDGEAVPSLRLVLVKANRNISKVYYAKKFEEGSVDEPDCLSIDGIVPDPGVQNPVSKICATCPKNAFGSRITDSGKKAKACSDNRRVVVVPEGDLANERFGGPMLLRIPPASLADLATFGRKVKQAGYRYNTVVTRVGFDMDAAYPKLNFRAIRPLNDEEANELVGLLDDPDFQSKMEAILASAVDYQAPADAVEEEEEDEVFEQPPAAKPAAAPAKKKAAAKKPVAAAPPPPVDDEDEDDETAGKDLDGELDDILASLDNLD